MAKNKKVDEEKRTCADCIHECACRMWTDGRVIADESASRCPNHTTTKDSAAYLMGSLDEAKRNFEEIEQYRRKAEEAEKRYQLADAERQANVRGFTDTIAALMQLK